MKLDAPGSIQPHHAVSSIGAPLSEVYQIDFSIPLGSGGMAIVYLGRDLSAGRQVAVRTLRPEFRSDPETVARFRREIRTMALLQHPNIARVYDFQEDSAVPWAVMEFVPGDSLKEILDHQPPLDLPTIGLLLSQLCDAVGALHDRGLVHLDIKPQNLMVTDDYDLKLIDFGLAQPAGRPQDLLGGLLFATSAYASPEQAGNIAVQPASDSYSIACVTYEMLSGSPPFGHPGDEPASSATISAHVHEKPPRCSSMTERYVPSWADALLDWNLAKRPGERQSDVRSFATMFEFGQRGQLTAAAVTSLRAGQQTTVAIPPGVTGSEIPQVTPPDASLPAPLPVATRRRRDRIIFPLIAIAIISVLTALLLVWGSVPGVYDGARGFTVGGEATAATTGVNVRAAPTTASAVILQLDQGEPVTLVTQPVESAGERWWPITVTALNGEVVGYVWEGALEPGELTGIDLLRSEFNQIRERVVGA